MGDRFGEIHEGDRVRINAGTFEAFEGVIREIDISRVIVEVNVFGRPLPIEVERGMIERAE